MAQTNQRKLSTSDLQLLQFAALHRVVLAAQAAALLGVKEPTARRRAGVLAERGLVLIDQVFTNQSPSIRVRRSGLALLGSELPEPNRNDLQFRHDIGCGWLWLAAHHQAFGEITEITSERQMRSADARPGGELVPYGVKVWQTTHRGPGSDRHYPDLRLVTGSGHRIAVELELSAKSERRLDQIMFGYTVDRRYERVLYLVDDRRIGDRVARAARRAGIADRVKVQMLAPDAIAGVGGAARISFRTAPAARRAAQLRAQQVAQR